MFRWDGDLGGAPVGGLHSPVLVDDDMHQAPLAQANDLLRSLTTALDSFEQAFFRASLPGEQSPFTQR